MLKRAGSNFRSKVSVRMMFIYAVVLIAFFGIFIPAAAETIHIDVQLPSGRILPFLINDNCLVLHLKTEIYSETGFLPNQQHLYCYNTKYNIKGKELKDGERLANVHAINRSTLILVVTDSYPPAPEPTTEPVYEEPVFYALPEDEIGAYAIRQDGTKEYLLFHTYDICMDWLASDELCSGFEHCFHKDGK